MSIVTNTDHFDLTGKVAVVTGGSRGLGRSMVQAFAEAGADVVIASRKLDNCERAATEVAESTGRTAVAVGCHVGHWDECDRLVDTVYERFGRVDVFVNNAGMSPLYEDLASITEELYDKTHAVNLKGPFRLATLVGTRMVADGGGSIINVSTVGSDAGERARTAVRVREGGLEPHDDRSGRRLRADGAGELHPSGRVPHRHHERVDTRDAQRRHDPVEAAR